MCVEEGARSAPECGAVRARQPTRPRTRAERSQPKVGVFFSLYAEGAHTTTAAGQAESTTKPRNGRTRHPVFFFLAVRLRSRHAKGAARVGQRRDYFPRAHGHRGSVSPAGDDIPFLVRPMPTISGRIVTHPRTAVLRPASGFAGSTTEERSERSERS